MSGDFIPSTIFNDGDLDISVAFDAAGSESEAKEVGNRYGALYLDPGPQRLYLLDDSGQERKLLEIDRSSVTCSVVTKELGPPIDCSTKEGREKALSVLVDRNPSYVVTEDDMKEITLDKLIELAKGRESRKTGLLHFESIAYAVNPADGV